MTEAGAILSKCWRIPYVKCAFALLRLTAAGNAGSKRIMTGAAGENDCGNHGG